MPSVPRALVSLLYMAGPAFAAGGHHAVDDAALMERGQCQFEAWADGYRGGQASWHLGPACRVGAWELGVNIDRAGLPGEPAQRTFSPQGKWATDIAPAVSAGIVLTATWQGGRYAGFQPLVPVTWQAHPQVAVHVNAGRDIPHHAAGRNLAGAALEWTPQSAWSFVAERFNDATGRAARVGARWQPHPSLSIDVSHARSFGDARGHWWTLGATYVIERK
ncbi:hypothetical protein [Ramlibacter sp. PS4R-6]|uniref:hypothetical protein n=1 Tax=Ramlibacter sp. PS4R-6 TaxID=3133438 RepID=UPI0030A50700